MWFCCGCDEEFVDFFSQEDGVVFYNDVCSVMKVLSLERNPGRWLQFIDSSKAYLKVVLLHKGYRFLSVPLTHSAYMKENHESIWESLSMANFKYKLCGDLTFVALLLGMQHGYTKHCCFLCEWDSRDKNNHYVNELQPKRTSLTPGEKNIVNTPFVLPEKIYLLLCT